MSHPTIMDAIDEIRKVKGTVNFLCCSTEDDEDLGLNTILSDLSGRVALIEKAIVGQEHDKGGER